MVLHEYFWNQIYTTWLSRNYCKFKFLVEKGQIIDLHWIPKLEPGLFWTHSQRDGFVVDIGNRWEWPYRSTKYPWRPSGSFCEYRPGHEDLPNGLAKADMPASFWIWCLSFGGYAALHWIPWCICDAITLKDSCHTEGHDQSFRQPSLHIPGSENQCEVWHVC